LVAQFFSGDVSLMKDAEQKLLNSCHTPGRLWYSSPLPSGLRWCWCTSGGAGFASAVCEIVCDSSLPEHVRQVCTVVFPCVCCASSRNYGMLAQFCAVILRVNVIKSYWRPEEASVTIHDAEKAFIRSKLPTMLGDASSKVRTAVVRSTGFRFLRLGCVTGRCLGPGVRDCLDWEVRLAGGVAHIV
jgi:hypothetical protein